VKITHCVLLTYFFDSHEDSICSFTLIALFILLGNNLFVFLWWELFLKNCLNLLTTCFAFLSSFESQIVKVSAPAEDGDI
jgi:hypothetical protein